MDLLSFFDSWSHLLNPLIHSVSQQATKTPLYCILISMLNGSRSGFVSDILTTLQHSLVLGIRDGDIIGSVLRVLILHYSHCSIVSSFFFPSSGL